jgi:hypothetical protein
MSQPHSLSQTLTCWMVCDLSRSTRHADQWFHRSHFIYSEEEGQRKLRWLRQWHPHAFLVKSAMATVEDNFHAPPLPQRSRATSETQPEVETFEHGLRLVK